MITKKAPQVPHKIPHGLNIIFMICLFEFFWALRKVKKISMEICTTRHTWHLTRMQWYWHIYWILQFMIHTHYFLCGALFYSTAHDVIHRHSCVLSLEVDLHANKFSCLWVINFFSPYLLTYLLIYLKKGAASEWGKKGFSSIPSKINQKSISHKKML